jgi:hypothetical protein
MVSSGSWHVGRAGGCPPVRAGIVSPAAIKPCGAHAAPATPNDHFTAGPDCGVKVSGDRRIRCGRSRPRIICARVGNFGKSVDDPALTLLPPMSQGLRRSAGIQRAEFGLASKNRRLNALLILVWPNTQR